MVLIFVCLYLLALIDCAFCGYRAAAGKSALIQKQAYYQRAMLRGALYGHIPLVLAGIVVGITVRSSPSPAQRLIEFRIAGSGMLLVYVPYAAMIDLAFVIRALPSVDIKSLTSVVIFGPLTLIRPLVAAAGIVLGMLAVPRPSLMMVGLVVLALMLSFEPLLDRTVRWS